MSAEDQMKEAATAALEESTDPKEKLRNHCMSMGYVGLLALGRLFRRQDDDNSGSLSSEEMTKGIQQIGLDLTEDECATLFSDFDHDGTGCVVYEEFLDSLRGEMCEDRINILKAAYAKMDESGNGSIAIDDLKDKYDVSQHPSVLDGSETSEDVLGRFLSRFEGTTSQDGVITEKEWNEYYCGISNSIDNDEYFIEMIKKAYCLE